MEIRITSHFSRRYKKLSPLIKRKAKAQEEIFKRNPFDSRLNTHKLHGERKDEWVYSVGRSYRVLFVFLNNDGVLYLDVGTHKEVY